MSSSTAGGYGAIHDSHEELDYRRLYITGIPKTMGQQGLHSIFSKYGPLNMCHINTDPNKRYGFVGYDTPGEAKMALLSVNRVPPFNLNLSYAKAKKSSDVTHENKRPSVLNKRNVSVATDNGNWDDNATVVSNVHGGRNVNMRSANMDQIMPNDDLSYEYMTTEQLNIEMERLEMLKAQHRYKMALFNASKLANDDAHPHPNIHITMKSEGKHIYKTANERGQATIEMKTKALDLNVGEDDLSEWSGPGLLTSACCVRCGRDASSFCARCRVTPYCSPRCQQADWRARHRGVCHNLASAHGAIESVEPPMPLMRLPHLQRPDSAAPHASTSNGSNGTNESQPRHNRKAVPPGSVPPPQDAKTRNFNRKPDFNSGGRFNQSPRRGNDDGWNVDNRKKFDGNQRFNGPRDRAEASNRNVTSGRRPPLRHETRDNDDSWDTPPKDNEANQLPVKKESTVKADIAEVAADEPSQPTKTNVAPTDTTDATEKKREVVSAAASAKPAQPIAAPLQSRNLKADIAKVAVAAAAVEDKAPAKEEKPAKCLVDVVSVGDEVMLTVERVADRGAVGLVCLLLHADHLDSYESLCGDYLLACEALAKDGDYKSSPGELVSVYDVEGAWYRARDLGSGEPCALLDAARLMPQAEVKRRVRLDDAVYATIPEYSCVLSVSGDCVKIGDQLQGVVLSRSDDGAIRVSMTRSEDGDRAVEGTLRRWRPTVKVAAPAPKPKVQETAAAAASAAPAPAASTAPAPAPSTAPAPGPLEPERPRLVSGVEVLLVDATDADRVFVRRADSVSQRDYDMCIEDVAVYGQSANPLKEPPQKGNLVVAKFTDDIHYRALVTRTHAKTNKYMLEYIEFGNVEVSRQERLYPCPSQFDLSTRPALVSRGRLHDAVAPGTAELPPPALKYLADLKENGTLLTLTLPSAQQSAASGSELILTVTKTNVNVNRKIKELCTPDWKKMEEQGLDIMQTPPLLLGNMKYVDLPAGGGTLQVLDSSMLELGIMSTCEVGDPNVAIVLGPLTDKMTAYCESEMGREPYYPRPQELCIAKCPPYDSWFRAVLVAKKSGCEAANLHLLYVDYGNMAHVPAADVRRMPPEFAEAPLLACHTEIQGLRHSWSAAMVKLASELMGSVADASAGRLAVTRCVREDHGLYVVEAPELLKALKPLVTPDLLKDSEVAVSH